MEVIRGNMLNFILNNFIFDYIIITLVIFNFLLLIIVDIKEQIKDKNVVAIDNINKIKSLVVLIESVITMTILYTIFSSFINIIIYFIIPLILLIKNIYDTYCNREQSLSTDTKFLKLFSSYFFIIFFSSNLVQFYYNSFSSLNHNSKEILLIIYLIIKIILFVFLLLNNMTILLSNINDLKPFKIKPNKITNKTCKFKDYDFYLYNRCKSKFNLFVDTLLYALLIIPTIIYYLLSIFLLNLFKGLELLKNRIINIIYNFNNNSKNITKKITNISFIIAFSIVQIIIISNSKLFSDKIMQTYNFLSTVILIPLIYDSIKSK